jgi:DNA-binding winged helix-turn-helix (wHTH) protein/Tfp pilus assembly protein PilF
MSNVRLWRSEWDRPFVLEGRRCDPAARRIEIGDDGADVEPRVMAVLVALAQRQGETVRRQELIDAVWDGAPGADQSLNNAISLLRRALRDADGNRRLIQTVPKQGYRLCAEVRADGDRNGASSLAPAPGAFAAPLTENAEAFEQYIIGEHELRKWTPDGNRRSLAHFKRAVALDPDFAEAHLAMGRAYYFAGTHYGCMAPEAAIPNVKASLVYGLSAPNPATRAAALSLYGDVLAWNDRDWPGALAAYRRAYELSGLPPLGYGLTHSIVGNHDAAIALFKKLVEDGAGGIGANGDVGIRNNLAWAYFNARRYEDALREAGAVLSDDAAFADGYRVLGRAQLLLGRTDDAIASFSEAARLMNKAPAARSDLAVALARAGRAAEARAILDELEALDADAYVPAPVISQVHANLGDVDSAFEWLEKGVEDGERGVIFLKVNPLYDPIRHVPRFAKLLGGLNLGA